MPRWTTPLVGLVVVAFAVWLVARNFEPPQAIGHDPSPRAPDAGAAAAASLAVDAGEDTGTLFLGDLLAVPAPRMDGGAGATLLDGVPVPALPLNVPREVRFGVVLVSYAGAQVNTTAGPPPVRPRAEARALAEKLAVTAQTDFHAAVQQGDAGSTDDLGHVKLGILEPAPEYVLFTLPIEGIGGPVETPRGFWIVKRLE